MTVNVESNPEPVLTQERIDTNLLQQKVDTNLTQQPENKEEDPNWKAFREARKKDRADKEAAERRASEKEAEAAALKAAMEAAFGKTIPNSSGREQVYEAYSDETEDERIEKKVQKAIAAREAVMDQERQRREQQEYPQRLAQTYHDFNQTISTENLDYLEYHYPEVASPLKRLQDGFDKWNDIYRAVKKFVPNANNAKKDSARADANFQKPKSMSSSSITQPGEAKTNSQISEEKKAANWERMQKMLKSVG